MNEIHLHKIHNYLHNIAYIFFLFYFVFGLFLQPIRMNSFSLGKHIAKVAKKQHRINAVVVQAETEPSETISIASHQDSRLDICMQSTNTGLEIC